MTKEEDFKLLKIQTCVLRVNIHCDGCRQKVKKLLQRIEGVFQVVIDAENQKVTVSGSVDPETLIKKLVRAGKHAELWLQKANQNQKQKNNGIKDDKLVNGKGSKQQKLTFNCEEDIYDCFEEDEGEDFEDEEFQLLKEKAAHLGLLRQRAIEANNAKKGAGIGQIPGPAASNGKMNNSNKSSNGKKVDPNQQIGIKNNPSGIDQKAMAAALRMNNAHSLGGGGGGGNINIGEGKRGNNDLNSMMNMAGFNGNLVNFAAPSSLGVNSNSQGGFQLQQNNVYQPSSSSPSGFPLTAGQYQPPSINGYNQHQSPLMMNMNMLTRQAMNQQPQMMYNRAHLIPPSTGYYYNYSPSPVQPTYPSIEPHYYHGHSSNSAADMFSDENTSSCSIM